MSEFLPARLNSSFNFGSLVRAIESRSRLISPAVISLGNFMVLSLGRSSGIRRHRKVRRCNDYTADECGTSSLRILRAVVRPVAPSQAFRLRSPERDYNPPESVRRSGRNRVVRVSCDARFRAVVFGPFSDHPNSSSMISSFVMRLPNHFEAMTCARSASRSNDSNSSES